MRERKMLNWNRYNKDNKIHEKEDYQSKQTSTNTECHIIEMF